MNLDVRLPIGLMFTLFGALLSLFGLLGDPKTWEQHPLKVNINLYWGLVLLVFGVVMLVFALRGRGRQRP
jgi:hypothetical protein